MARITVFGEHDVEVSETNLKEAQAHFQAYKSRNPADRYTKSASWIVNAIAYSFEKEGVRDVRGLIGSYVSVGGKGWS